MGGFGGSPLWWSCGISLKGFVFENESFAMIFVDKVSQFASRFNKQKACLKFVEVRVREGGVCSG